MHIEIHQHIFLNKALWQILKNHSTEACHEIYSGDFRSSHKIQNHVSSTLTSFGIIYPVIIFKHNIRLNKNKKQTGSQITTHLLFLYKL